MYAPLAYMEWFKEGKNWQEADHDEVMTVGEWGPWRLDTAEGFHAASRVAIAIRLWVEEKGVIRAGSKTEQNEGEGEV
jgi:hypothetical protein